MGIKSAQGKSIRRKSILTGLIVFLCYTAVFVVAASAFWDWGYQKLAYKVADQVSPWNYVTEDEYNDLYAEVANDMQYAADTFMDSHPSNKEDAAEDSSSDYASAMNEPYVSALGPEAGLTLSEDSTFNTTSFYSEDLAFWSGKGLYAWRDLSVYHDFLAAEPGALLVCYLLGLLVLLLFAVPRLIKQVDSLACAVSDLFADKSAPINLPRSLSETRTELIDIQNRELHNEQATLAAEQRKNELVAYLAHDIRTPLTSVIGYLDILRSTPELPADKREQFANVAYEKAERLDTLMEEFFEITRYNLQSIPIERERVDLGLFCHQIAESMYPQTQAKSLEIEVHAPVDETVFIDPEKMARACGNLLRNAIAYSDPASTIVFSAERKGSKLVLEFSDQGKEISPEHLDAIFEKFFREDAARTSDKGGAGLGLAISKEIIEAHGGSITATSEHGLTTFSIEIPNAL